MLRSGDDEKSVSFESLSVEAVLWSRGAAVRRETFCNDNSLRNEGLLNRSWSSVGDSLVDVVDMNLKNASIKR